MADRPRLFWDSSALIDVMFAVDDSPYYELFGLGEAQAVDMRISPDVLRECDAILRRYSSTVVALFAVTIHEANFATTLPPSDQTIEYCVGLTGYRNDARILAAAEECLVDVLVTHDRTHFIGNPLISPPDTHCRAMTAQQALEWRLSRLAEQE